MLLVSSKHAQQCCMVFSMLEQLNRGQTEAGVSGEQALGCLFVEGKIETQGDRRYKGTLSRSVRSAATP